MKPVAGEEKKGRNFGRSGGGESGGPRGCLGRVLWGGRFGGRRGHDLRGPGASTGVRGTNNRKSKKTRKNK